MKLVKVGWYDARWYGGWEDFELYKSVGLSKIITRGILIEETDTYIVVIQSDHDNRANGGMVIPKNSIFGIVELSDIDLQDPLKWEWKNEG